jgi:hypothetical protein
MDIAEAALAAGFPREGIVLERKRHPRDFFSNGRVRVRLFQEDGSPVLADVRNKQELLLAIAGKVPGLPNFAKRKEALAAQQAGMKAQIMAMFTGKPPPGMPSPVAPPAAKAAAEDKPKPKSKGKVIRKKPKK